MNDLKRKALQKLINKINRDAQTADALARSLFAEGHLFLEAGGQMYVMDGDSDGGGQERQTHIVMTADGVNPIGHGAW